MGAGICECVVDELALLPLGEGEGDRQEGEPARRLLRLRGGILPGVGLRRQCEPAEEVLD